MGMQTQTREYKCRKFKTVKNSLQRLLPWPDQDPEQAEPVVRWVPKEVLQLHQWPRRDLNVQAVQQHQDFGQEVQGEHLLITYHLLNEPAIQNITFEDFPYLTVTKITKIEKWSAKIVNM